MRRLSPHPPRGWNSFDSFGGYLHEQAAFAQLEACASKLAPHGYDIFVVDIGWYGEYELKPGTLLPLPLSKHAAVMNLDEYGRPLPSKVYFPKGFGPLARRTHELGLRFGVHLMRGVPRAAVHARLPVRGAAGTNAADIADTSSTCPWCPYNYGIDVSRRGGREYYQSIFEMLAAWEVDFVKVDDVTGYPQEIDAVADALEGCGRPMLLSLSHGGEADPSLVAAYRRADMVRITKDIWDDQESIERSFLAWDHWQRHTQPGFWPDLDMIPFGELQTMSPAPQPGEIPAGTNPSLCGKGFRRKSGLTAVQRRTFLTQRALAASPLFVGGDMTTMDADDVAMLTNPGLLACQRNGVSAKRIYLRGDVEVRLAEDARRVGAGWIGVFNRNPANRPERIILTAARLRMAPATRFRDVWDGSDLGLLSQHIEIILPPQGCSLLEYHAVPEAPIAPPEPLPDESAAWRPAL